MGSFIGAIGKQRQFCEHTLRFSFPLCKSFDICSFKDLERLKWFAGTGTHTAPQINSQFKQDGGGWWVLKKKGFEHLQCR